MVGDWVMLFSDRPSRIDAIGDIKIYLTDKDGEDWRSENPFVRPIPITQEILEKNGFVFTGVSRSKKPMQLIGDGLYISWWKDRLTIRYKREAGRASNYLNVDCPNVHDMQHAFRLCGIEKEITF